MKACAVAAGNDRYGVLTADGNDDTDYSADRDDLIAYRKVPADRMTVCGRNIFYYLHIGFHMNI